MTIPWWRERRAVADSARELADTSLVSGAAGNVSARLPDATELMAITPRGKRCSDVRPRDVVVTDFHGEPREEDLTPSSEALLHAGIYRARPGVGAVVHTHSVYASVAAVAGVEIPPLIDEMVVTIGGPVRTSQYAFPGTQDLADRVLEALEDRNAALIRNHGAVGVGRGLEEALEVAALIERVSQIYVHALLLGRVNPLPEQAVRTETEIYRMKQSGGGQTQW